MNIHPFTLPIISRVESGESSSLHRIFRNTNDTFTFPFQAFRNTPDFRKVQFLKEPGRKEQQTTDLCLNCHV